MTFHPDLDAAMARMDEARGRQRAQTPTAPHHHFAGSDAPHIVQEGITSAGGSCTSAAASCHIALDAGLILPCPACEDGR